MPRHLSVVCIVLCLFACSRDVELGRLQVTPGEGAFLTSDEVTLAVPPGAVDAPLEVVARMVDAAPDGALSPTIDVLPADVTFANPALIGIPVAQLPDGQVIMVRVDADGSRQVLDALEVDRALGEVRGATRRLGRFVVLAGGDVVPVSTPADVMPLEVPVSVDAAVVGHWAGTQGLDGFELRIETAGFEILNQGQLVRSGEVSAHDGRIELLDTGGNSEIGQYTVADAQLTLQTNSGDTLWLRAPLQMPGGFFQPQSPEPPPIAASEPVTQTDEVATQESTPAAQTGAGGFLRGLGRRLRNAGKQAVDTVKRQGERLRGAQGAEQITEQVQDTVREDNPYAALTDNLQSSTPLDACALLSSQDVTRVLGAQAAATALHATICRYQTAAGALLTVTTDFDAVENHDSVARMIQLRSCSVVQVPGVTACTRDLSSGALRLWIGHADDVLLLELRGGGADARSRLTRLASLAAQSLRP